MLAVLKAIGGPFTNSGYVDDFMKSELDELEKVSRLCLQMYIDIW